jgi:hypothetical protein
MARQNKINLLHVFTVEGNGGFPADMLRYDRCWPKTETEARAVDRAAAIRPGEFGLKRCITLEGLNPPTPGRWSSFGWKVVEMATRAVG